MVMSERSWLVTLLGRFRWSGHLLYCQSVGVGLSYALFVLVTIRTTYTKMYRNVSS
jgi:hypothetical protein